MRKILSVALFVLLLLCVSVESGTGAEKVLRVQDGKVITFDQMIDDLKKVSIVMVGETHDVQEHHEAQLEIIRAFHESDAPVAIGLEMFRAENQAMLDSWAQGKLALERFIPVYYDNWQLPWPLYRDIFLYARDHELSLIGLNIPDAIAKKVGKQGFASLTEEEKKHLPPQVSCNVDPTYMEFIRKAYAEHSRKDREFVNFCEAQMIWDKSMAWHTMGYLKKNPNRTIVVLAGVGHAWKRGISEQLAADSNFTYRVVLPLIPGQISRENVTTGDADYLLLE